ncbi:hypothetical protein [Lachnoclostridium phytofermentans]|uniref:Uncharacterized protein n=1 Tax=Lachnoclostridium phytofermentans (strain ATCC 700394 / DSM 18823 / ISDg) TaxID=357809 RepID=A9KMX9_LACP7|nr:hypothetical protein [Lachnoclostridium phytofermentans]ABX42990.1 hypothetical protein Cphy_2629 [Lachnoclostridium phytofermentans ISDg]
MEEIKSQYFEIIENKKKQCTSEYENLKKDDRKDEADLVKIKENIYEIFEVLFKTHVNQLEKLSIPDEEKLHRLKEEYTKRFETIPKSWIARLELAQKHNDVANIVIEELKLQVVKDLKEQFLALY